VAYGYWAVLLLVGLESMGVPLPGETALIAASIYAGTTHQLSISGVVIAAATGAVIGDNLGYEIGRRLGFRLLLQYGGRIGLDARRLKLGQYLFHRYGGAIVFFGRFVAVLRALAAVMAGANRMPWGRFFLFNAAGALAWSAVVGLGGYAFGASIQRLSGPIDLVLLVLALAGAVAGFLFLRRHEERLLAEADRTLPGPLPSGSR
jgi:membrane protein DedA with SNARE-associated domain